MEYFYSGSRYSVKDAMEAVSYFESNNFVKLIFFFSHSSFIVCQQRPLWIQVKQISQISFQQGQAYTDMEMPLILYTIS